MEEYEEGYMCNIMNKMQMMSSSPKQHYLHPRCLYQHLSQLINV
jgi:hypothetical protein